MAFPKRVQSALEQYDQKKGFFRRWRWLSWLFGKDSPAICAMRALEPANQNNLFQLLQCFIRYKVKPSQASFLVFKVPLAELFCSSLQNTPFDPKQHLDILFLLKQQALFTEENITNIEKHTSPIKLANALLTLNKYPLLISDTRVLLHESDHPDYVAKLLILFYEKQISNQKNRPQHKKYVIHQEIINVIKILGKTKILTEKNIDSIQSHSDIETLSNTLQIFYDQQLLTQDTFHLISGHTELSTLASIVQLLDYKGLLTQENCSEILVQTHINTLTITLIILYHTSLLTQHNLDILKKHLDFPRLNPILNTLSKTHLLTQDNFDLIVQCSDLQHIAEQLSTYQKTTFTQADFENIMNHSFQPKEKTTNAFTLDEEEEEEFFDAEDNPLHSSIPNLNLSTTPINPSYQQLFVTQPKLQDNDSQKAEKTAPSRLNKI